MLYLLINQLGWLAFMALLIVVFILYARISQQIRQLRHDMTALQAELKRQKEGLITAKSSHADINSDQESQFASVPDTSPTLRSSMPPPIPLAAVDLVTAADASAEPIEENLGLKPKPEESTKTRTPVTTIEPDERSLPIVTSIIHSMQNWFFGGNLVVRVGVLVLLVGVVLLLRLLSDYIEIPIAFKLIAIGVLGLGLAALGLKLVKNRFAYGITLQGAGLAIAYLTTFLPIAFIKCWQVYQAL